MTFFYNLNKKLDEIRATPSVTHSQLNERDMSRAAKGYEKYGKEGMEALAKAGREGKDLDKVRDKYNKYDDKKDVEEGLGDVARKAAGAVGGAVNKVVDRLSGQAAQDAKARERMNRPSLIAQMHGPEGAQNRIDSRNQEQEYDRLSMGDRYGESVDENLGDVARKVGSAVKSGAKALGKAIVGPDDDELLKDLQKKSGIPAHARHGKKNMAQSNEGVDKEAFAALAPPKDKITFADKIAGAKKEVDEMLGDVAAEAMKAALGKGKQATMGEATREIPGGRRHTSEPGGYGRKDDEEAPKVQTQRGRGRPKKNADSETGEVMKPDWSAFGVTGKDIKLPKHKGAVTKHKMVGEDESADVEAAIKMLKKAGYTVSKDEEPVNEKAVSKKQQKFMGMVHAAQKGEKPASKEVAKVAKSMGKKDAEDFAATKHKGLPEKVKKTAEEEKVDETTTSGSVATAPAAGGKKSSGGFAFGGGIYDSMNRDLENMIAESMSRLDESMNISMNMNNDSHGGPTKSLTITATDDDAEKLGMLLKMAGMGGDYNHGMAYAEAPDMVDENKPDWPTNTETSDDAFQYSGGINKPKTDVAGDGQSTGQVTAVSTVDKEEDEEDELGRMMEMAGMSQHQLDEGMMDKLKSLVVPKLMKMVGAEQAAQIANTVKQVTGGDFTPSKENAIKVARAFGFDKMQPPGGQAQQMAEGIAGNWQGKLIQLLYSVGTIGGLSMAGSSMTGTFLAVIGGVLLMFANTFFGDAPGQIGTMGNFGNKGTDMNKGLDDHGMPIRTQSDAKTNPYKGQGGFQEQTDLDRMMEMAGVKKAKPDFLDMDKDGDKSEPMKKAVDDKKEKAVKESILDLQNLWTAYKG